MTALFKPAALSDQIYDELKRRMLTCELRPGERLIEKNLCDQLGVSRTSLREALNRLAAERLVTLKPNCGFRVTPITEESFRNVCELRRVVESQVAALAAQRANEREIEEILAAAPVDAEFHQPDANIIYCQANRAFHQAIAAAIDNLLLEETVLSALDKDQQPLYYGIDIEVCTTPEEVTTEHLAIAEAIANRNAEAARQRMWDHIGTKEERILEALKQRESVA